MFIRHSDSKLIEGIKKGDNKTVDYLYKAYFGMVRAHVLANSGSDDDAYDIFQDAIMVLFKKIQVNHITLSSDLKGYIYEVARNLWSSQLRKNSHTENIIVDQGVEGEIEKLLDVPLEVIVQRSMLKLKPDSRKVLQLHLDGYSYKEITRKMKYKSEEYARRKKHLAKEELMKIVKSDPDYSEYESDRR